MFDTSTDPVTHALDKDALKSIGALPQSFPLGKAAPGMSSSSDIKSYNLRTKKVGFYTWGTCYAHGA